MIETEIDVTENGRIVDISKPAPGQTHDLEIRRPPTSMPTAATMHASFCVETLEEAMGNYARRKS